MNFLAVMLGAMLLWLSVSLPFVYEGRKQIAEQTTHQSDNKNTNPFTGSTEEKVPNNPTVNINEEYLHRLDYDLSFNQFDKDIAYMHAHEGTYIAFHPETDAPPPNRS